MEVEYLTPEFVIYIHLTAIDEKFCEYGGQVHYDDEMRGIKDINLFKSALYEPQQSFSGQDLYPTILSKAACYLRSFSMNHPFFDGNKRTALLATIVFLEMNGYRVIGDDNELYNLVKEVVEEKSNIEQIVEKFSPYIRISKMSKLKKAFRSFNKMFKRD